jgi:hypothetical protein
MTVRFLQIVFAWIIASSLGGWILVDAVFRFHGSIIIFLAIVFAATICGLVHGLIDMVAIRKREKSPPPYCESKVPGSKPNGSE